MTTEQVKHVEELMLDAEEATEPGDMGSTVDLGEAGSGTIHLDGTGWVRVWDVRTGEESIVPRHPDYLRTQLQKTDSETGRRIFTTVRPRVTPFRGTEKCPLHEESPNFEKYQQMGLPVCKKANLRNPAEAERHLRLKHKDTFDLLEREREREIEEEERLVRRGMIDRIINSAGNSLTVNESIATNLPVEDEEKPAETEVRYMTRNCPDCGEEITAESTKLGVTIAAHKRTHNK